MEPEPTRQIPSSGLYGLDMRIFSGRPTLIGGVSTTRSHHALAQEHRGKLGKPGVHSGRSIS